MRCVTFMTYCNVHVVLHSCSLFVSFFFIAKAVSIVLVTVLQPSELKAGTYRMSAMVFVECGS